MRDIIIKISWIMFIVLNICLAFYLTISGHGNYAGNFIMIAVLVLIGLAGSYIVEHLV